MKIISHTAIALSAFLIVDEVSEASDQVIDLDSYTVTASRSSTFEAAVADRVVSRLDQESIKDINPVGVSELMERIPGVHVDSDTRSGSVGSLYLRGGDPNFTMVLMNGVKLNDPTNSRGGSIDLSMINPLSVKQVELVNGAQSAIHGSEAISGVINLSTFEPVDESGGSIHLELGADGFLRGDLMLNQAYESGESYLSLDYIDGGDAVDGGSFKANRYGAGAEFEMGEASRMHVFAFGSDTTQAAFPDDSGGAVFAEIRELDRRETESFLVGVNYGWSQTEEFSLRIDASLYDRNEVLVSPGVAPGVRDPFGLPSSTSDDDLRRYQLTAYGEFLLGDNASVVFGWSGEREQSEGESEFVFFFGPRPGSYEFDRDTSSFFAEGNFAVSERVSFQLGGRMDDVDGLDSEATFLGGLNFALPEIDSVFRLRMGEAFKKPSVFALNNPLVGNPNLVPETSESIDLSWTSAFLDGAAEFEISAFSYDFRNLVDFDSGPPPMLVNRTNVKSEGGEFALRYRPDESMTIGSYVSYADTRDQSNDQRIHERPTWRAGGFISKAISDSVDGMLDVFYVGDRIMSSFPTGDVLLGGYTRVDVRVSWAYNDDLDVVLSVDNLFDKQYEEAVGFIAPGISPRLAVRTAF